MRRYAALCVLLLLFTVFTAHAHPGGTDSQGGHTDRSTGEYHYHHGYSAHQHENGECPYDFDDKTGESSGSSGSSSGRSYSSVTPRPTVKPTVKPTPRVTPRATARASVTAATTSKEDDPVSFNSILLCVGIGIAIGAIVTVILTHRWVNNTKVNANMRIDSANNDRIREIAKIRAECDTRIQKAKDDYDGQLRQHKAADAARYRQSKDEYVALVADLRKFTYQPDVESRIMKLLNHPTAPDLSEGVVYVKRDLSVNRYHYRSFCDSDLVLASKATMKRCDFKPCPCCFDALQPEADPLVDVSYFHSEVYHEIGAMCIKSVGRSINLSEAMAKGRRPCKMCRPVDVLPKVWY